MPFRGPPATNLCDRIWPLLLFLCTVTRLVCGGEAVGLEATTEGAPERPAESAEVFSAFCGADCELAAAIELEQALIAELSGIISRITSLDDKMEALRAADATGTPVSPAHAARPSCSFHALQWARAADRQLSLEDVPRPDTPGWQKSAMQKSAMQKALAKMEQVKLNIPTSPDHRTALAREVTDIVSLATPRLDAGNTKTIRLHAQVSGLCVAVGWHRYSINASNCSILWNRYMWHVAADLTGACTRSANYWPDVHSLRKA